MATFTAFEPTDAQWLREIFALTKGVEQPISGGGTSVQYDWSSSEGNVVLTLTGTGFTDPISSSWLITDISAAVNGKEVWAIDGISNIPGDILFNSTWYGTPASWLFLFNDTINGTSGNDQLNGYSGNDVINGGAGNDQIAGGSGHNTLTGGPGRDMFVLNVPPNGSNISVITDFHPAQDLIDFYIGEYPRLAAFGVLPIAQFHIGAHAATAAQHIIYNPNTGNLYYDANGSHPGQQELIASLHRHLALTHTDFLVS
jgi:Ca2+-binding RTX toxin-like protein